MATYWWRAAIDTDANTAGNWYDSETGGAAQTVAPTASDDLYFSDTASSSNCVLSGNLVCNHIYTDNAETLGADDWSGTLDIVSYDLDASGDVIFGSGATLQGTTASNTGITAASYTFRSGSTISASSAQIYIRSNGNFDCSATVGNNKISYTQAGDGTYSLDISLYEFIIDADVTMTINGNITMSTVSTTGDSVVNGTLALGSSNCIIGGNSVSSFTFGTDADVTGDGTIKFAGDPNMSYYNNKSGVFSYSGTLYTNPIPGDRPIWSGRWDNAVCSIRGDSAGSTVDRTCFYPGDVTCKSFDLRATNAATTMNVNMNVNDNNITVLEDIDFEADASGGTINYTKGTGTITLGGSSGAHNIDFNEHSVEDIVVDCGSATKTFLEDATTDSLTITAGTLDISTYDLISTGTTSVTGTLTIGSSSNTGLTTAGLIINAGATIDLQTDSLINNSGVFNCHNSSIWANNNRGTYTQTSSANYAGAHVDNKWYSFTINVGATITCQTYTRITDWASNATVINGTIDFNGNTIEVGADTAGSFTFGSSSDLLGSTGNLTFLIEDGATFTNDKSGAFTTDSVVRIWSISDAGTPHIAPPVDVSNGTYRLYLTGSAVADSYTKFYSGTIKAKTFEIESSNNNTITLNIDASTNNPYIEAEEFDLSTGVTGDLTIAWAKGTGTITLYGSSNNNVYLKGQSVEDIIVNSSDIKTLQDDAGTTETLTISSGTFDIQTYDFTSTGLTTVSGANGILKIGSSASNGFTTAGLDFSSASNADARNWQTDSIVSNSGDLLLPDADISTNNYSGDYTQTTSANWSSPHVNNRFSKMTVNVGVNVTMTGACSICATSTTDFILNGTIDNGGYSLTIGSNTNFTIGASADFIGSGLILVACSEGGSFTITNNQSSAFSHTGLWRWWTVTDSVNFAIDASNSSGVKYYTWTSPATDQDTTFISNSGSYGDTVKTQELTFESDNTNTITVTIDNSANPSFEVSGNIDLGQGIGDYTLNWSKGTGTLKLTGTDPSIDLNAQDVETIFSDSDIGDVTIITGDTWNIGTLDLTVTDLILNGQLTIGVTDSTGLTVNGNFTSTGGSESMDLQETSKLNFYGDVTIDNDLGISAKGIWTFKDDGTLTNTGLATCYEFEVEAGVTITLGAYSGFMGTGTNRIEINGAIDTNSNNMVIGASATGSVIFGSGCDFLGSGDLLFTVLDGATYTNDKSGAFSHTGEVRIGARNSSDRLILTGDFSNSVRYKIYTISTPLDSNLKITNGTLKAQGFYFEDAATYNVDANTNDPSFEISGDFNFQNDGGETVNWTKGTGSITLTSGDATTKIINFNGETVEDIIVNTSTASDLKQLTNDVITDSLTITTGELDFNTNNLTSLGVTAINDTLTMDATSELTTAGLTTGASSTWNLAETSKIYNSGQLSIDVSMTKTSAYGDYYQTGSTSTFTIPSFLKDFYGVTIQDGVSITLSGFTQLCHASCNKGIIFEGTGNINVNGEQLGLGASGSGEVTFSSGCDISGSGTLQFAVNNNATYDNSKTDAFSFTGTITNSGTTSNQMLCADWSNATLYSCSMNGNGTLQMSTGTLKCGDFEINVDSGFSGTLDSSTNDPDFEITGNIDFAAGAGTHAYTKGTGSMTLAGGAITGGTTPYVTGTDGNLNNPDDINHPATGLVPIGNAGGNADFFIGTYFWQTYVVGAGQTYFGNALGFSYGAMSFGSAGSNWTSFAGAENNGLQTVTFSGGAGSFQFYYHQSAWQTAFSGNQSNIIISIEGAVYKGSISQANLVVNESGQVGQAGGGGGGGDANIDFNGQTVEELIVDVSSATKTLTANGGTDSLDIQDGTLDVGIYDFTSTGLAQITGASGNLTIGVTGSIGFTAGSISFATGEVTGVVDSIIHCNGDCTFTCDNTTDNTIQFYQDGTATTYEINPANNNRFRAYTLADGESITFTGGSSLITTASATIGTVLNGTIDMNGRGVTLGSSESGVFTFGINFQISGGGAFTTAIRTGATFTNNASATTFSFTGTVSNSGSGENWAISGDWRNATYRANTSSGSITPYNADLRCKTYRLDGTTDVTIDFSSYTSDIYVYEDIDLAYGAGTHTYTKGGETWNLIGSGSQNIDFAQHSIANVVVNASGATRTCLDYFTAESLTMTDGTFKLVNSQTTSIETVAGSGGTLQSDSSGNQTTISLTNNSTNFTGTSFKDLFISSSSPAVQINAKDKAWVDAGNSNRNINLGNCLGYIFFNDILISKG